jgi:hypothetical protein
MTPNVVKVLIAIPNMGYAHSEAYGNRLLNFMKMGSLQRERMMFYKFAELLNGVVPDKKDEVLHLYLKDHGEWIKKMGDEVFEFWFLNVGRIFTPAAREEAAKKAIEYGHDYIFFVDDDMICPDDLFLKLYRHRHVADIVCPLAFTRNPPYRPVLYSSLEGWDPVSKSSYFINNVVTKYPRNKLVETDACGFGAALIKTWMLKKIQPPYFMSSEGTGEDILFCYKAKKVGARVFMDTSINIGHLGHPQIITEEFVDSFRKTVDPDNDKRYPDFEKYKALTILGD